MTENKEPIPEYLDRLQPDVPEPQEPDSPSAASVRVGAKWGAFAGIAMGQFYMSSQSIETQFGSIYAGNAFLVLVFWIAVGTAVGAGIGWLVASDSGDDADR